MFDQITPVKVAGGAVTYFTQGNTTNGYVSKTLGNGMTAITVSNDDGSDAVQVSYDGATLEFNLLAGETITLNCSGKKLAYIKGTAGGGAYRISGW